MTDTNFLVKSNTWHTMAGPEIMYEHDAISPIPVVARSNAWVCGCLLAGTASSNPAEGMDICCDCCVIR